MDLKSILSTAKKKDEFLNKALEARQARELSRRKENAATVIQSHVRKFLAVNRTRISLQKEFTKLHDKLDGPDFIQSLKRILFLCHLDRDIKLLELTLRFVHKLLFVEDTKSFNSPKEVQTKETEASMPANSNDVELSYDKSSFDLEDYSSLQNLRMTLFELVTKDLESSITFERIILRMIKICLEILIRCHSSQTDLNSTTTYLQIINFFTNEEFLAAAKYTSGESCAELTFNRILDNISSSTSDGRKRLFSKLLESIPRLVSGPKTVTKAIFLDEFVKFSLRLIDGRTECAERIPDLARDRADICIQLLSIPALIYYLKRNSSDLVSKPHGPHILSMSISLLSSNEQRLQLVSATPALCMLGNMVQLSYLNMDLLSTDLKPFVVMVIKLLELCQRNMKQMNLIPQETRIKNNHKMESTDESYNHILGWLTREKIRTIDQELSKLIKDQLSHLWSSKLLKILLHDLIKTQTDTESEVRINTDHSVKSTGVKSTNLKSWKASMSEISLESSDTVRHQRICDTPITPLTSIRRAVERATFNMTKSMGNTYSRSVSSSCSQSGCAKLMTEKAKRIALVCLMLHTTLKTLKMIKQDILTGLCIHDYVLCNLWSFIKSLGPNNGIRAFLDFLTINTKTNMPELHILILFCECASHIISILDDPELYEQQKPFSIEDLKDISAFLNMFVYRLICNHLVSYNAQDSDPLLQTTHKLLTDLCKRDSRRKFTPQNHWLIKDVRMSLFLKDLEVGKPVAQAILTLLPHVIPHKERVLIFRRIVHKDHAHYSTGYSTFITIHRSRIVEDGYQQLAKLPPNAMKGLIRVKFINDHGLDEAGIDQDGVFKEFLEDTIKRVFDPGLNLFCTTSEQRLYPSPTSHLHDDHLSLFNFVGKMLGKALYEGIVVDVPFATFFLSRVLGQHHSALYSPIDELPSLDPELYKSLTYIKHYEGDVSELDLTFSIDQDIMGKIVTYELESGGKFTPVTKESRVRYIHSVANFRMRTQIEEQTEAFVRGFKSIINLDWLHMFSASELQRLISGDTAPIDLHDLRKHTKYFGGFHNNHRVICWLWDILEKDFTPEDHHLFLKFITSCSKPPLLGFANLEPPFSIRCVEVSDDQDSGDTVGSVLRGFFAIRRSDPVDRLPTSSTCFNLLKLPNYQRRSTLREKLRYAIRSSPGFELS